MNLIRNRPKNETEDLILSITKNCETLFEQTHRKAEKTLEFKMIESRETFRFIRPILIEGSALIGLTDLEVYNSLSNIKEENCKIKLYEFPDENSGVSYEKVRAEIEKDFDISHITAADLQDDIIGPIIIKEIREQITKGMEDVGYMNLLARYPISSFQNFEIYLRTEIDLVEDDIRLVSDKYHSGFSTNELQPSIYIFEDLSETLFNILQLEYPESSSEIVIEFNDITNKNNWL